MKKINLFFTAIILAALVHSQSISDFENLTLASDTFWNGSDLSGGFSSGTAFFANDYNTTYQSWSGFVYSDKKDSTTAGYTNQYSAITAGGFNGSSNYVVADEYGNAKIKLIGKAAGKIVSGFYVTNSTYAYLSMKNGGAPAKKFGGASGTDPDWFRLTVKGWRSGSLINDSVDFYLADYRSSDSTQDYIVRDWRWVNLSPLGDVDSLKLNLASSDTGTYGMNTPAYFCIDNFTPNFPMASNINVAINYEQDTLINVLASVLDTVSMGLSLQSVSQPLIPGSTVTVDAYDRILYHPAVGVVANDILAYTACNEDGVCGSALIFINVFSLTGMEEITSAETKIFPNPFIGSFVISHSSGVKKIVLYDLEGREVRDITDTGEKITRINGDDLSPGAYLAKMISNSGVAVAKIIKQ